MALKTISISNFKFGLDTRREELSSQPGTLVTCENAHINVGGEIEKRKAFAKAVFGGFDYDLTGTFGFLAVDGGIVVFMGVGTPIPGILALWPHFNGTTPPMAVVQLQHPQIAMGGGTTGLPSLVAVPAAVSYKGVPFAVGTFSDGNSFLYYGSSVVNESWAGRVLANVNSSTNLANALALLGSNLGWTTTAASNHADIKTPSGVLNAVYTPSDTDPSHSITVHHISDQYDGVPSQSATASFAFSGTPVVGDVIAVGAPDGLGGSIGVGAYTVVAGDTLSSVAAGVALMINNSISNPQYSAKSDNENVTISGPVGETVLNGLDVLVTSNLLGIVAPTLVATATPSSLVATTIISEGVVPMTSPPTTVTVHGYAGTLSYAWEQLSGDTSLKPTQATSATTAFTANVPFSIPVYGVWRCKVTDSIKSVYTNHVAVQLFAVD